MFKTQGAARLFRFNQYPFGEIDLSLLRGGMNGGRIIDEVRHPPCYFLPAAVEEIAQQGYRFLQRPVIREKTQHHSLQGMNERMPVPGAAGLSSRTGGEQCYPVYIMTEVIIGVQHIHFIHFRHFHLVFWLDRQIRLCNIPGRIGIVLRHLCRPAHPSVRSDPAPVPHQNS